jgi:transcriptional regulator with GAF, ATPase, and Fis domain/tetratricopeptide (TPR) repeat protein
VANIVVTTKDGIILPVPLGNRFNVIRALAQGAFGEVFEAEDLHEKGHCVVKVVHGDLGEGGSRLLALEFARLTALHHPNLVRIRGGGTFATAATSSRAYLAMDQVLGGSLADALENGPLEDRLTRFSSLAEGLADGLAYLHSKGIVHRDITPKNVRCQEDGVPVLFDLGLAIEMSIVARAGGATGTFGYMAPEALLGDFGPSSDLFSLGATLYEIWTGVPPFGHGPQSVARLWQGPPPVPSSLHEGLPPAWDQLLLSLLALNIEDRPGSARLLLQSLQSMAPAHSSNPFMEMSIPYPAGDPLAGFLVGRSRELAVLHTQFERLAEGEVPSQVVVVAGPVGSGRRYMLARAIRDLRLGQMQGRLPTIQIEERGCQTLTAAMETTLSVPIQGTVEEQQKQRESSIARLLSQLEVRAQQQPLCVFLGTHAEDRLLAEAAMGPLRSGRLLFIIPMERPVLREGVLSIELLPLEKPSITELASMASGVAPSASVLDEILAMTGGLAAAVSMVVRNWVRNVREGHPERVASFGKGGDLAALLDESFASLSYPTQSRIVECLFASKTLGEDRAGNAVLDATDESILGGWLNYPSMEISSPHHAEAVWRAATRSPELKMIVARRIDDLPLDDPRKPEAHRILGERNLAESGFWTAMAAALSRGALGTAAIYGRRARDVALSPSSLSQRLILARILGGLGSYEEALDCLSEELSTVPSESRLIFVETKAWLLKRCGAITASEEILRLALIDSTLSTFSKDRLCALLARTLLSKGRYQEAYQVVRDALLTRDSAVLFTLKEAAALALAYMGDLAGSQNLLEDLAKQSEQGADNSHRGQLFALEGLLAQFSGNPAAAAAAYRRAATAFEAQHDVHGTATAIFNLGCASAETGRYTESLQAFDSAIREMSRLGADADCALATFNVGSLFLELGDLTSAKRCVVRLREDAHRLGLEVFQHQADLIEAQYFRASNTWEMARALYDSASAGFEKAGMKFMAESTRLDLSEMYAESGDRASSLLLLTNVQEAAAQCEKIEALRKERLELAKGRIWLRLRQGTQEELKVLAESLWQSAEIAMGSGRRPAAWRLASLAGSLFQRISDGQADECWRFSIQQVEAMKMNTPTRYWTMFDQTREGGQGVGKQSSRPEETTLWLEKAAHFEERLKRLLRINKRLNSDLRLSRILETIIDTVIEITDAERGFLLLRDGHNNLVVRVARNIDQTSLDGPDLALSRSIAKQVADGGVPVLTVDASGDSRFREALSVSDLHLRSVLAVPLHVKGSAVGTIYVDHRLRQGAFREEDLAMVMDFAEQGAIAIENARLMSELRHREQQVQSLNHRLERELRVQVKALQDVTVELKESRVAAALRYDYANIVGQSPAMLDLFRLLDRVTDTSLPVVIEGESGTGKELVARAIHYNGVRKERPFVFENCAAIPETLLESVLFGHVRGAFTGADRDTKGLFAVADGGTLFLDEVAEMSAGMQGKLLRVLQEGEFHRVGSERSQKVDVRVIAATNKNLATLVDEGKFRKDLFFRLNVLRLHLPPLRERREDIPLLVAHFLKKQNNLLKEVSKTIQSEAVSCLMAYGWPGNVRELENEMMRAMAFSSGPIRTQDLSPHVVSGVDARESAGKEPDTLKMKSRVERLERHLIREALNQSAGNQTKTAKLLGVSRFGLQKKLHRYGITP